MPRLRNGGRRPTRTRLFLALDVAPQEAYANIQALRMRYRGVYGAVGFFDAVNPVTGAVGHRDLVLDQSMIMAAMANALTDRALQRDFARDPVSWAARTYLHWNTCRSNGRLSVAGKLTGGRSCRPGGN